MATAMTGGSSYLLKETAPFSDSTKKVQLYLYVVESADTSTRKTTVKLGLYVKTPSGWEIGPWGEYGDSALAGTSFDGAISAFSGTKWLVSNVSKTVSHDALGAASLDVAWSWGVNSSWGGFTKPSGTKTITITKMAAKTYTVSYNANGGSGAPSNQTKTHGTNLTLSSTKPTRTGYDFTKWNTKSDGSGTAYSSGGTYSSNAAVTLYAQWSLKTYSVTYNANGGEGAPDAQTKKYGTDLTLRTGKPTRDGYNFSHWDTAKDGSGTNYDPGDTYTKNAAVTLYAQWTKKTYTVSYNANGGSGAPSSQTKTHGTTLTLSSTKPTKTGHTFSKWNTKSDGSGTAYSAGGSYTANAAVTLYAQWTADTYAVKYNANGGEGAPSNQTKTYGVDLTLSSTKPTKTGYDFQGWGTSSSDTSVDYAAGAKYTKNAAITLYAIWKIKTYTVSYNANGGSGAPSSQTKTYGKDLTLSSTAPTRSGWTFKGWGTTASDTSVNYAAGGTYTSNANEELFAIWAKTLKLSYSANSGSGAPSAQSSTIYNATTSKEFTISSTKPTRTGYDFQGWAKTSDATSAAYSSGGTITITANTTLYAVWKIQSFTLTIDPNGGKRSSDGETGKTTSSKNYGSTTTITKREKTGYDLTSYKLTRTSDGSTSAIGGATVSDISSSATATFTQGTVAVTATAQWTKKTYAVKYNANGGTGAPSQQTKTYGTALTLSSTVPTKAGRRFTGWNTASDGSGTAYAKGASYTANAAVTLYAQWEQYKLEVNYYSNYASSYNGTTASLNTVSASTNVLVNTSNYYYASAYSSGLNNYNSGSTLGMLRTGYNNLRTWGTATSGGTYQVKDTTSFDTGQDLALALGKDITSGDATVKVYAQWSIKTYAVTYNANGTSVSGMPSNQTKTYGTALTLSSTKPTRTGYTFEGWNTAEDGSGTNYASGASYTSNAALTLYAKWKIITYSITYNANGGSGAPSSQTKNYGEAITLSSTKPTKTDYIFAGWNTKSDGSGTDYEPGSSYKTNAALTLYAQWAKSFSKVGTPTNVTVVDNGNNTVTFSCKVGSNGTSNKATGVNVYGYYTSSSDSTVFFALEGAAGATVSETVSFAGMSPGAAKELFGSTYSQNVRFRARTVGAAGSSYYSSYLDSVGTTFTYYGPAEPPTITSPVGPGVEIAGLSTNYTVSWSAGAAGVNNALKSYTIRVVDTADGSQVGSYSTTNTYYAVPKSILTAGHTYRFYVKTVGAKYDSTEAVSEPVLFKSISKFGAITPTVSNIDLPTSSIFEDYDTTAYLNTGTGNVFKLSWSKPSGTNNILSSYTVKIKKGSSTVHTKYINDLSRNYYVNADVLNSLGAGLHELTITVDADSAYGTTYSTAGTAITVYVYNGCAGGYVNVLSEDLETYYRRRAIAFVKIKDSSGNDTWVVANKALSKDSTKDWHESNISYELLFDSNGEPVEDKNGSPIYVL